MFSKKAAKIEKIFTMDLTLNNSKYQINGEDLALLLFPYTLIYLHFTFPIL